MAKKTPAKVPLITSKQRKALIREFTAAVEGIASMPAASAEKWANALRKALPVILASDPQEVLRALKHYADHPPVKPLPKAALPCPPIGTAFRLMTSTGVSKCCRLISVGFQRSFENVQKVIEEKYAIPPAGYLKIFKACYPHTKGSIALAVATDVSGQAGLRKISTIHEDGSECLCEFYSNKSFGSEILWIVVDR